MSTNIVRPVSTTDDVFLYVPEVVDLRNPICREELQSLIAHDFISLYTKHLNGWSIDKYVSVVHSASTDKKSDINCIVYVVLPSHTLTKK